MQFIIPFSQSLPVEAAILRAGQSAMTTAIFCQQKVFDISRLSLIGFSISNESQVFPNEIEASVAMKQSMTSEAGTHYEIAVGLGKAHIQFEIIDRNRGLRSQILHNLHQPKHRIQEEADQKEVSLQDIGCETWTLEALLMAALPSPAPKQFTFNVYGTPASSHAIALSQAPDLVEITQENALIAQLI